MRQAVANLVDRQAIATDVYKDTYTPLYSYIPEGLDGATQDFKEKYGDGKGGPDLDKAKQILADAGVETPINLALQYSPEHYGPSSGDEYAAVKNQLEEGGLFSVDLQSTEWVQYSKDRVADVYPALPARLVPRLLGSGQLPDALLQQEQLSGQPLRESRRDQG